MPQGHGEVRREGNILVSVDWPFAAARPLLLKVSFSGNKQSFNWVGPQAVTVFPSGN